jgi:uncharacterized membrane protein
MSRPTAGAERLVVLGGFPAVAPRLGRAVPWVLVGATVLVQIVYPLMPDALRTEITVASVLVFCAAALADAGRVHGLRGAAVLLAVAGGGGLLVEAVGVHTGVPFGAYAYTGDLGAEVLGVPAVVPLAWTMMAWPALVVGRTLARRVPVALVGGAALAAWDLFLDPQMVTEGYWTWRGSFRGLPGVPGVPLGNYLGWLVVALVMMVLLATLAPRAGARQAEDTLMHVLYMWTYCSSVLAHAVFLGLPWSALWGGLAMGVVAVPLGVRLWRSS